MLEQKYCIVCGFGSHRDDWASQDQPACDHHSQGEVDAAKARLKSDATQTAAQTTPQTATGGGAQPAVTAAAVEDQPKAEPKSKKTSQSW